MPPQWEMALRWRNWAFESAALDLALNQAGPPAARDRRPRAPRPCASSTRSASATRRRSTRSAAGSSVHPGLRFKLDVTPAWTPELMDEVAATGAVEIVDFKGQYGLEMGEPRRCSRCTSGRRAFPDALLEDAHDLPEVTALLEPEADRISYDAPIRVAADLDATPLAPRAVNIKPCRVGDLRSLLDVYAACEARGLIMYGGGMGELDVGRGQIQLLASLFHPDGPNDVAPSGYNADAPAADLPPSPLPASPAPTGFRRAA